MTTPQFNPFTPEFQADPYPGYRQLREADPMHWSQLMQLWVLTRYEDVEFVLRDQRFSANRRSSTNPIVQAVAGRQDSDLPFANATTMLGADPPEHTRLRGLVSKAFTPRSVEAMRPRIQQIVDELLESAEAGQPFDLIEQVAYPLPVIVIAEMLGVAAERRADFKRWSDDLVATLSIQTADGDVAERARDSGLQMADYFRGVIAERREQPEDDLLSRLIAAEDRGEVLSEDELLATCMLLLAAGNETTTNLIGNGMLALLRQPDQLAKLQADPALLNSAVEEMLRYDGPVQATARVATEDMEVGGSTVEKGQILFALLAAANHDPAVFDDPESFDITRDDNRHLAFGHGLHFCLGAPVARLEAQVAFRALLERFPNVRLATDAPPWNGNFILRGLTKLPLTL